MKYFVLRIILMLCAISIISCNNTGHDSSNLMQDATTISQHSNRYLDTPERLQALVDSIAKLNIVEHKATGISGWEGPNYRNFKRLKATATTDELIALAQNENVIVACYAAWALADQSHPFLKTIFNTFLNDTLTVKTFSGCIQSEDLVASAIYHRYWNAPKYENRADDQLLQQLDSTILFHPQPDWLLTLRALDNRVYGEPYKSRILELAFQNDNKEALFYISDFHKAEYYKDIETTLLQYLRQTHFKTTGTSDYFRTIAELLEFKNPRINEAIVEKMKTDKHWHHDPEKFRSILDHYGIYYFSWSPH